MTDPEGPNPDEELPPSAPPKQQEAQPSDIGTTRRGFLKSTFLGALSAKQVAGLAVGGAAVAAGAAYGTKRAEGKVIDDLPVEISDDYKPFDQRNMVFSMTTSRILPDRFPEKTKAWEEAAQERGKKWGGQPWRLKGSFHHFFMETHDYWQDRPGWTQLDFAIEKASWHTSLALAGLHAAGAPNKGVFSWEQSDVEDVKYEFESKQQAAEAIKTAARLYGAARCGITHNDPRWNYEPLYDIETDSELSWDDFPFRPKTVIVMLVEMDYRGIRTSPSVLASAAAGQGYSEMTVVAGQVARFLRLLGYQAVGAGNDLAASVPYAMAAGLGQEGRHGALIAPGLGPRVRICKVFTDFDFVEFDKPRDFSVTSFCTHCKRCADSCPSQAILHDDERSFEPVYEGSDNPNYTATNSSGVLKWHNDMKKCFEFWTENGGDCGSCINACPYNKPDFWHHHMVDVMQPVMPGPVHWFMKEMDRVFGYGSVYDEEQVKAFWKTGKHMRGG